MYMLMPMLPVSGRLSFFAGGPWTRKRDNRNASTVRYVILQNFKEQTFLNISVLIWTHLTYYNSIFCLTKLKKDDFRWGGGGDKGREGCKEVNRKGYV